MESPDRNYLMKAIIKQLISLDEWINNAGILIRHLLDK